MGTPLSESLASGDREAFAALYDRLGPRLFRTARMMLSSTAEAEDVVHDLFVELARLRHRLARAVAALPAAQREVLALKIDGGLTFAEIAVVIGTSANTAASRYRYALEKLRVALETHEVLR